MAGKAKRMMDRNLAQKPAWPCECNRILAGEVSPEKWGAAKDIVAAGRRSYVRVRISGMRHVFCK